MAPQSSQEEKNNNNAKTEFESYYLQRATQEMAGDLDKVRKADDFKADSIQFLVHALQQGASQFSEEDQRRVVGALKREGEGQ